MNKEKNQDIINLNLEFVDQPVLVTSWRSYGIVRDVKNETTFLVENKYGQVSEVDMHFLRSLSDFEVENNFKPVFNSKVMMMAV